MREKILNDKLHDTPVGKNLIIPNKDISNAIFKTTFSKIPYPSNMTALIIDR
jgi:hypothetical protein